MRAKTSALMPSDAAQIQFICFVYSSVSRVFALQRVVVMMRVSGRSSSVSVSVFLFIFTFELKSKSRANSFTSHGYFCTVGFGVFQTTNV